MTMDYPFGPSQEQIDAALDDYAAWKRDRPEEEVEPQDEDDELREGDLVWVALPGDQRRVARVRELRPSVAIVCFEPGHRHIHHWDRKAILYKHLTKEAT